MADGVDLRVGIPDFKRQLRELGDDMERKIVRAGVSAGALIFRKHLKTILQRPRLSKPKRGIPPGTLERAIYTKRVRMPKGHEKYFVGIRQGKAQRSRKGGSADAYYWRWVHEGHAIRAPGRGVRGGRRSQALQRRRAIASGAPRVRAYPFFPQAFERGKTEALRKFNERIEARILKANAKR